MLEISFSSDDPAEIDADLLVVACPADGGADNDPLVQRLDARLAGVLRRAATEERFRGKAGQSLVVHAPGLRARRVALVGLGGSPAGWTERELRAAAGTAVRIATSVGAARAVLAWSATHANPSAATEAAAEGAWLGGYRFDKYLTDERSRAPTLASLTLAPPAGSDGAELDRARTRARSTARAVARARDLVNEPAGVMTPTRLASTVSDWTPAPADPSYAVEVFDRAACARMGMGLYLAVAQGSAEEPRFIHLAWTPPSAKRRVVLVGKGVTFDSGGLSLKTNDGMLDMKTDMAGAAAVLAAATAAAEEKLPVEVHALAACTENMPSGSSYKLGDVLRSLDGKTVEINNTDAEGRLTLADALSFGIRLKPDAVLDFATLTGACVVALGPYLAGLMSNDDALAAELLAASARAGEDMWRLPLPPRLAEQLKSEIADFKNTGERWGGALTAGLFLKEFVGDVPWVHVDIAGPASTSKEFGHQSKGATGFAVASILEYLRRAAAV
jgi:leucyl aminopeptidase